jgi:hypothetical protein
MAMKQKSNRKKSKARARSPRAKPLYASTAHVRRDEQKVEKKPTMTPFAASAGRLMASYMGMPMRLAWSRFPFELWRAQALVAYQGLMMMQSMAFGGPTGLSPRIS